MTVITISHQMGSGGRAIGQEVARRLSLSYVDREIVSEVARALNAREDIVALHEEHTDGVVGRILSAFSEGPALILGAPALDPDLRFDELACHRTTRAVIEAAARSNLVLIAGHGANFALRNHRGVLNVFLYAPHECRVAAVIERDHLSRAEAVHQVSHSDQSRAHYIRRFYHADWHDPAYYHLMMNTAALPPDHAADIIVSTWRRGSFGAFC